MAITFVKDLTGPQTPAANLFAVPGSSERARDAGKGMRRANGQFVQWAIFSAVYGVPRESEEPGFDAKSLHLAESSLHHAPDKKEERTSNGCGKIQF
ncbi:MAG: hypothetical protein ACRD5M_09015 [Candidatus Acidiferrales bacterium]